MENTILQLGRSFHDRDDRPQARSGRRGHRRRGPARRRAGGPPRRGPQMARVLLLRGGRPRRRGTARVQPQARRGGEPQRHGDLQGLARPVGEPGRRVPQRHVPLAHRRQRTTMCRSRRPR
ncbi:hypothetical protein ACU686_27560 [Yinghuangia aomiensis]